MTEVVDPEQVIRYEGVSKRFVSRGALVTAVEDVSLSIRQHEFTSVVGPSGCGKTTLLRLAAGLEIATEGSTLYRGRPVTAVNTDVGYVTQDSNLYPWMTLRENVEFALEVRGLPAAERRERVAAFIELVGLTGFENHYPYQLSGGMQKRGSIIRTMIYDPSVILMDEPFGPLDAQTRMVLQSELLRIAAIRRQTILFITHDLTEAIALSDTVVVMSARPGRVKQVFRIPLSRPRDVFRIHEQDGFAETYGQIWECFRSEVLGQQGEVRETKLPPPLTRSRR
jgi:NitT/TauT family transport system ATP-binding protein